MPTTSNNNNDNDNDNNYDSRPSSLPPYPLHFADASSSSFPAPRPSPYHPDHDRPDTVDLNWSDFLRSDAAETTPVSDRSDARKRRHAGPEPDRRDYPYPTSFNTASPARRQRTDMPPPPAMRHNASSMEPIYLTGAMNPRRQSGENGSLRGAGWGRGNSDSTASLPRWQPDNEAARCFVCQSDFSFFFRKHHCRKCGRVVCNACSPHRITIPRQYIVLPDPSEYTARDPDSPTTRNPALGGGEVVRVCNPCVPDPWTPTTAGEGAGLTQTMRDDPLTSRNLQPHEARMSGRGLCILSTAIRTAS